MANAISPTKITDFHEKAQLQGCLLQKMRQNYAIDLFFVAYYTSR